MEIKVRAVGAFKVKTCSLNVKIYSAMNYLEIKVNTKIGYFEFQSRVVCFISLVLATLMYVCIWLLSICILLVYMSLINVCAMMLLHGVEQSRTCTKIGYFEFLGSNGWLQFLFLTLGVKIFVLHFKALSSLLVCESCVCSPSLDCCGSCFSQLT